MTQLDKIENILSSHVKKSNDDRLEMAKQLVAIEINMSANHKKILSHEDQITELNNIKNQGKGAFWILGIFWLAFTIGIPLIVSYFNHK